MVYYNRIIPTGITKYKGSIFNFVNHFYTTYEMNYSLLTITTYIILYITSYHQTTYTHMYYLYTN